MYNTPDYPNLLFSEEVFKTLHTDTRLHRNEKLARKLANALDDLNDHGTDTDYHARGNLESLGGGWWALRIRHQKDFWRVMFRKADSEKYGLAIMYLKKTNKIPQKNWDAAKRVAKREGWL
jgi:phage-related protein